METQCSSSNDDYRCNICDKNYKNKSGIWKHNRKHHIPPKAEKSAESSAVKSAQNQPISSDNKHNGNLKTTPTLLCKYCNCEFKHIQSRWRHEQKCKLERQYCSKDNIINNLSNKITELEQQLNNFMNASKIHPKTLEKINKNLVTGNNNSNNNNTVNNIQIVKFGSEDIKSILSDKEIKKILNCKYKAIEESIKTIHFNDDRPEYRNIYITNLRDNIAYIYNGNKFEAVQKHSIINQLIDQHMNNIEVSYDDYKNRLPEKTVGILDKLIEKIQDEHTAMIDEENNKEFKNYKMFKINEVKLMIYNETGNNTEVIKLKYSNSMLNKHNSNHEINV